MPADRLTATALDLAQRLSDRARIPVDVRILNVAPVSFVYHVLRGQLAFCRDDAVLAEVMERIVSRYLDIAPLVRRSAQEAFAAKHHVAALQTWIERLEQSLRQ